MDYCKYTATVLCTFLGFTTSTSVRTEPQATSATPEEKKKSLAVISRAGKHLHNDIAKAIKALEQKKRLGATNTPVSTPAMMCTLPTCHDQVGELSSAWPLHL